MFRTLTPSKWTALSLLAVAVLVGSLTAVSTGENDHDHDHGKAEKPAMDPAMMAKWMKMAMPNEHHAKLNGFAGKWDVAVKFWMSADAPPAMSKATSEVKWVLDGRFLQENYSGMMSMGAHAMPFKGLGMLGYDNAKKQYVRTWADTMSTSMMTETGQFDQAGKTLSQQSDPVTCPMTGVTGTIRAVSTIRSANQCYFEMFQVGADGKEYKCLELTYTRK